MPTIRTPAHTIVEFSNGVKFSSQFDNGNMAACEMGNKKDEYKIWTAPDCAGTEYERSAKVNAWFYFNVTGLSEGTILKICIVNASNHSGLYKHDMRPVYKSNTTNQKFTRIKNSVKYIKHDDGSGSSIHFEHRIEVNNDHISFAFTYPYTYTQVQNELNVIDANHKNNLYDPNSIYYNRETLIKTQDSLIVDLLTITASNGADISDWDISNINENEINNAINAVCNISGVDTDSSGMSTAPTSDQVNLVNKIRGKWGLCICICICISVFLSTCL